jgi:hypothetical protein
LQRAVQQQRGAQARRAVGVQAQRCDDGVEQRGGARAERFNRHADVARRAVRAAANARVRAQPQRRGRRVAQAAGRGRAHRHGV